MTCQLQCYGKNKKKNKYNKKKVSLSSAEFAQRAIKLNSIGGAQVNSWIITKTCLYNFDPRKPLFYIIKLGFTGVYIIFLVSAQKHRLWVIVRTASARRF